MTSHAQGPGVQRAPGAVEKRQYCNDKVANQAARRHILGREQGAMDMRQYFDLMKQRSVVRTLSGEEHARPCQETVYAVWALCQLIAQVHDKGMAHGDLNPSNILLIELDKSYSIHGEGFVVLGDKHYKIVLCDGGGSIQS